MKDFLSRVDKALLGSVTMTLTFLLGFLWWVFSPFDPIPMWVLSIVIILSYALCVVVYAVSSKKASVVYRLPEVRAVHRDSNRLVFIVEKNELLSYGSYVTIFWRNEDDESEIILCLGIVETINSEGNMQISLVASSRSEDAKAVLEKTDNTKRFVRALRVRPSVSRELLDELMEGVEVL